MKKIALPLMLAFAVFCSGCIPIPYQATVRPGVEGFVMDAQTGLPVVGANIRLDSTNFFQARQTHSQLVAVSLESMTNGAFSIQPQKKWRFELTPNTEPNDGEIQCHLLISHVNYEPYRLHFRLLDASLFWPMPQTKYLTNIYLQPLH